MAAYRNDVDALAARTDVLAQELKQKSKELDVSRTLLDQAKVKASLPVLPNLRVATPCSADWNLMTGDDRVRACGACEKNVYNVSSLTRDEAEALIVAKEGKLCVRYFQRKDGTILLKDCSIGIRQKRGRRVVAAVAALLGGAVAAGISLPKESRVDHWAKIDLSQGIDDVRGKVDDSTSIAGGIGPSEIEPMMGGSAASFDPPTPNAK